MKNSLKISKGFFIITDVTHFENYIIFRSHRAGHFVGLREGVRVEV
jgi:hypothetical protein